MPIFGKGRSARFDYYLLLHSLSPFPASFKNVYIVWQRGSGKRGQTRTVSQATEGPGRSWTTFQFDEAFSVPCTLNQESKAQGSPYEKKWLILAIMDGDKSGKASKEPLGRVVINLADYAAEDDRATMSFTVAVNKAITSEIGECKMLITLGCRRAGKAPMVLGGKQVSRGAEKESAASSENSDEDTDSVVSHTPSVSVPMGRPSARNVAAASAAVAAAHSRAPVRRSSSGFGGTEPFTQAAPAQTRQAAPAKAASVTRQQDSDADSEDEFLAQAVAAMDNNAPIPVAPSLSRQTTRERGREGEGGKPELREIPSIGRTISAREEPPARLPMRPMFSLRPEGQRDPEPEPESEAQAKPAYLTRTASKDRSSAPFATRPPAYEEAAAAGPQVVLDRPERASSHRQLDSSRLEKPVDASGRPEPHVVLPTGTVSISRRPVVSIAPDDSPPAEAPPVKPSAPGRHWLDEPEDLGVDPSPPESPVVPPVPAFQAVKPAPLKGSTSRNRGLDTEALFSETPDPATNPFLSPEEPAAATETATVTPPVAKQRQLATPQPSAVSSAAATPSATPTARQLEAQQGSTPGLNGMASNGLSSQASEVFVRELRALAALEASVYLARSGKSRGVRASSRARHVHAPARRLARTTISLGPEEGIIFGLRAVRAMEAAADGAGDIAGQAYWWSNCIQLRWMLWAMCRGGDPDGDPDSEEFDWVMQVLVPPLRELEAHIFQQLFQYMWSTVLMEGARADQLPGAQPKQWIIPPSKEEEAVQRWIDALQMVHRALLPALSCVTEGHVTMLKHKCLTALMRRLDAALLDRLVGGEAGTMRRDAFSSGWRDSRARDSALDLPLDGRLLPFQPQGALSFGVGVNLKMAATRWTNWAADIGLRNDKGSPEEGYMLFPKLRASADLLMMPKEVLTDRTIRSEVVPGLPLRVICELLSRFQPDELANEPLPPGLLEALQNETPPSEESPSPISQGLADYEAPTEAALLADGLIEPVSLEMDEESEDELETLIEMYDPDRQGHTTERFNLLRELWASAR